MNLNPPSDLAIPTLPSRRLDDTLAFYRPLGFEGEVHSFGGYAILQRGTVEIHFFSSPELEPSESNAGCYIRVSDAASIFNSCSKAGLPSTGIPRMDQLEEKPWGMREFAIIDPDGNQLRIGQPL